MASETPMMDELEKGPWPSFVTEIKRAAEKKDSAKDLLKQQEEAFSEIRRLTNTPTDELHPAWSPDGTQLILDADADGDGNGEIYLLNIAQALQSAGEDGLSPLTNGEADDRWADWSPDGTRIALSSNRDGNYDIYAYHDYPWDDTLLPVDTDLSEEINPVMTGVDVWVWILWQSNKNGDWDIYGSNIFLELFKKNMVK